jgi:hypothetical protein
MESTSRHAECVHRGGEAEAVEEYRNRADGVLLALVSLVGAWTCFPSNVPADELGSASPLSIRIGSRYPNVFTDAELLRGLVPALALGCIVETSVTIREHRPLSRAGTSRASQLGSLLEPTRLVRVVLESPESSPIQYRIIGSAQSAEVTKQGVMIHSGIMNSSQEEAPVSRSSIFE